MREEGKRVRFGRALVMVSSGLVASSVAVAAEPEGARTSMLEEVVVTAQKVSQNINDVGMSIDSATGDELYDMGVKDTADLVKLVPGFNHTYSIYGTPIYTIRGVGFVETTLSSGPTVSVYTDEVPIPFAAETKGALLDVRRVEVLKGPQGTLYGQNSTGGAINYIANRPTEQFEAGFDVSYGRFSTTDIQGFVSGSLTDTVRGRLSVRSIQSQG
jgi:outer membrane receptor protein involved in Fe transport